MLACILLTGTTINEFAIIIDSWMIVVLHSSGVLDLLRGLRDYAIFASGLQLSHPACNFPTWPDSYLLAICFAGR